MPHLTVSKFDKARGTYWRKYGKSTSTEMTRVFHVWPYDRFLEIKSNLGEGNFIERIKAPVFLEVEMQSNLEEKVNPSILKDDFFLKG